MPKFTLVMACDNDAFADNPAREVARILAEISEKIESADAVPDCYKPIRDYNGNEIGRYAMTNDAG